MIAEPPGAGRFGSDPPEGAPTSAHEGAGPMVDPLAVLRDLPAPLWDELLAAVRRATDRIGLAELPRRLRPFATFAPGALAEERPREAVAQALASDARLRAEVGEAVEDRAAWQLADSGVARLVAEHGEATAAAVLAARGRFDDLALLAAEVGSRLAARARTASEAAERSRRLDTESGGRRLLEDLSAARAQRDAQRVRAEAVEARLPAAERAVRQLENRLEKAQTELDGVRVRLEGERRRARRREERLRRRLQAAEDAGRIDSARLRDLADRLEALGVDLRAAVGEPREPREPRERRAAGREQSADTRGETAGPTDLRRDAPVAGLPRRAAAAAAGRPCRLPPGLTEEVPRGVDALLRVPGLQVLIDGYNVTKHPRGRPLASLDEQRRWLLGLVGGLVARFPSRCTVVFDGTESMPARIRSPRGVRVAFSEGEEIADTLLIDILTGLEADTPALVVSADREVSAAARALDANVVSPAVFLASVPGAG